MSSSFGRTSLTDFSSKGRLALTNKCLLANTSIGLSSKNGSGTICVPQKYKNDTHFYKILLFGFCQMIYKSLAHPPRICHY